MENNSLKFYEESGIAPVPNLVMSFLTGSIVVTFFSFYYSLLVTYMPFIYINVIVSILYGYLIALTSDQLFSAFKIRNRKKTILFAFLIAIVGNYSQWVSYMYVISTENIGIFPDLGFYLELYIRPDYLIENMVYFSENGAWELFGVTIKGLVLWCVWLSEFAVIMFTVYYAASNKGIIPFSESSNQWFSKYTIDVDFEPIRLRTQFIESYTKNPVEAIKSLEKGNATRYAHVHIYKTKRDGRSLVSIDNLLVTERGKGKKEKEEIIAPHYLDNHHINQLMQEYKVIKNTPLDAITDLYF
jgi:hypothetical protein